MSRSRRLGRLLRRARIGPRKWTIKSLDLVDEDDGPVLAAPHSLRRNQETALAGSVSSRRGRRYIGCTIASRQGMHITRLGGLSENGFGTFRSSRSGCPCALSFGQTPSLARAFLANQSTVRFHAAMERAMAKKAKKSTKKPTRKSSAKRRKASKGVLAGAMATVRKQARKLGI
jgi:hypothetical protein